MFYHGNAIFEARLTNDNATDRNSQLRKYANDLLGLMLNVGPLYNDATDIARE